MAKRYEPLFEFTGEALSDFLDRGAEAVYDKIRAVFKKGNACRIRLVDPEGDEKFKSTLTIGIAGVVLSMILLPLFSIIAVIAASTAIAITDYKLIFEEVIVEEEKPTEG